MPSGQFPRFAHAFRIAALVATSPPVSASRIASQRATSGRADSPHGSRSSAVEIS